MDEADKINVSARRQSYLEKVPDHGWLVEMWERTKK